MSVRAARLLSLVAAILVFHALPCLAGTDYNWDGGGNPNDNDWTARQNWDPQAAFPVAGDNVDVTNVGGKTYVLVDGGDGSTNRACATLMVRNGMAVRVTQTLLIIFPVNLTVSGDVTVENGAELVVGNGPGCVLYCGGSWNNNGNFGYSIGGGNSGTVQLTGAANNLDADGSGNTGTGAFWNLTIANGASYTLLSNVTVDNNLTIAGSLNLNGFTLTVKGNAAVSGTLNVGGGALAVLGDLDGSGGTINNGTGTVSLKGSFTPGTYNCDTGSFNYNGATQTIAGLTYHDLRITGSNATLADGNTVVNNTCVVDGAGKINLSNFAMTFANNASITVNGEVTSNGGTLASSGAGNFFGITFNGVVNIAAMTVNRPNDNGITINASASIAQLDNITYTAGQNGASSRYLYLGHSSGAVSFVGHNIDANCSVNVTAPNGALVAMINSSGAKGGTTNGELNDGAIDANITWSNPVTWQGDDATSPTLWSVGENWSTGAPPTPDSVVIIPNVPNQPVVDIDAACFSVTVQSGATVRMSVADKTLEVRGRLLGGQLNINAGGAFIMSAAGTVFKCGGTWNNSGTFTATNGTVVFHSQAIDQNIPSQTFNNLSIDKPNDKVATATGNLTVNGSLSVTQGLFRAGAYTHTVAGSTNIFGTLELGSGSTLNCTGAVSVKAGGTLKMTDACTLALQTSLTVDAGATPGQFLAAGATPTVTWYNSTRYAFTVNGAINVTALNLSYPNDNGLTINDGATISSLDGINFTNGQAATTTYLRILDMGNTSYFAAGASFDANCVHNVYVPAASNITVNMVNQSGTGGARGGPTNGPIYEDDPGDHIFWYAEKVWAGGQNPQPDQWNERRNWSPNNDIPRSTDFLRIPWNLFWPRCRVNIAGAACRAVIINNFATLQVIGAGNALTVGEYLKVNDGGRLVLDNEDTLTVGGNWTNNGTFTLQSGTASGTVVFNGNTVVDKVSGSAGTETFDNLTISGAMTITDGDGVTVLGTFNPAGGTINAGSGTTLTTTGSWTALPATFNRGTSTVVLNGTANVPAVTFHNLTIGGACTLTADVTVKNNLAISPGASLNLGSYTLTVEGNVTNGGTLNLGSGRLKVAGAFATSGTFTPSTGTVEFNGSAQTIPGTTYYNLDVNGSTAGVASGVTVSNRLNVLAGTLALGSATLTFGNGAALDVDGVFTSAGGTLTSTGAGASFGINIDGTINVNGLTVNRPDANGLTIQGTANVQALDNVTYTNGVPGSGQYLWIGHATGTFACTGHSFDASHNWNVVAPNGAVVSMVNATEGKGTTDPEDYDGAIDANITFEAPNIWQGNTDQNWSVGTNWSKGHAPTAGEVAWIPDMTASGKPSPVLNADGQCKALVICSSGLLTMSAASTTLTVSGNVSVNSGGTLTLTSATTTLKVGGAWQRSGTFTPTAGTVSFNSTAADQTIPAETFYSLKIDKSGRTATLGGNVTLNGSLTVAAGTLDLSSKSLFVTAATDISGKLSIPAGGTLNASGAVTVKSGGELSMNGSGTLALAASLTVDAGGKFTATGLTPTVTWNGVTRYAFTVNGAIEITALSFNYPNASGLTINNGATIVGLDSLDCNDGPANGTYLRVLITAANAYNFSGCDFDGNCQFNVEAANGSEVINMIGAAGAKAGEAYDVDPGETHVFWYDQKVWDGSTSTAWNEPTNWSGNSVPTAADNVLVPSAARVCNVNVSNAVCQSLQVSNNGTLTIGAGANLLTVSGSVNVGSTGTVNLTGGELRFTGGWTANNPITATGGLVTLNGGAGQAIGGTASPSFYDLTVTNNSAATLNTNVTVANTFTVAAGSSVIVPSGRTLTLNTGTALSGTLDLRANSVLRTEGNISSNAGSTFKAVGTSQLAGGYVTIQNNGSGNYSVSLAGDTNVRFARVYNLSDSGWTLNGPRTAFDNVVFYAGQSSGICYLRVLNSAWNTHTFYSMGFEAVGGGGSTIEMGTSTAGCAVRVEAYAQGTKFGTTWRSGDLTDIDRDNPVSDPSRGVVTWSVTAAEGLQARSERVPRGVLVSWTAAVERLTAGYTVLRRRAEAHGELLEEETAEHPSAELRPERFRKGRWQKLAEVPVEFPGGSPEERRYHYLDQPASDGDFEYCVQEVESNGERGRAAPAGQEVRRAGTHDESGRF